ncbi:kinesin-like protein KIN-10C isoform X2 [Prunus yedoensis var. nudiflora]|uniref:Kinesin-like protein KIN-10C isoform X2 n=1 Tax=Prunus yedoensis var. nudiflora TaxID=2094558 RepID=A0A314UJB6_PRUYE|nr:kinesin-like protein KIN-10C isoform X2 [Prunus yedoensis var. nudiflora]
MASSLCDHPDRTKTPMRPNPSWKVRVVAKIGGLRVRRGSYQVREQEARHNVIFSREVKPLIPGILDGCNATVIAFGARGSGKTCLIQGSSEKPGLAALAMAEILSLTEKDGIQLLYLPMRVMLKEKFGLKDFLRQVPVKSISEFYKLCVTGCGSRKPAQKVATELPRRSHKGLIVHVSSPSENSDTLHVGKLNFVDLAGYEDTRKKSINGLNLVENSKIHKTMYAMLNVVHALSTTENHVPYRESKLTHLLQDSLGGASRVLMVTCLKPSFCPDSIYMVSLVSRSFQNNNGAVIDSTKKTKCLTRSAVLSSRKIHVPKTISVTAKKQTISRVPLSDKKINGSTASVLKGRKLFDETSQLTKSEKVSAISDVASTTETSLDKERYSLSDTLKPTEFTFMAEKDNLLSDAPKHAESTLMAEKDVSSNSGGHTEEVTPSVNSSSRNTLSLVEVHSMEKENKDSEHSLVQDYLSFLNTASKEELKRLNGIGEKRATYILELRDESPKPFKNLDDLKRLDFQRSRLKE